MDLKLKIETFERVTGKTGAGAVATTTTTAPARVQFVVRRGMLFKHLYPKNCWWVAPPTGAESIAVETACDRWIAQNGDAHRSKIQAVRDLRKAARQAAPTGANYRKEEMLLPWGGQDKYLNRPQNWAGSGPKFGAAPWTRHW